MIDQILDASDQVSASVENKDGTQNIYLTADPTVNVLTLTLSNKLSQPIIFPAGTPVASEDLPAGQSAVYLYLNGLIDNADIERIVLSAPGWAAATFTDSNSLQYLVIAPVSQVTVAAGTPVTFTLGNVLVQGSPRSGTADIDLAGATGVTPLQSEVPLFVNIASPPQPDKLPLDVLIGFRDPVVYTGQPQSLTLHLVNGGQAPLVPGGKDSWHGVTPTFQLTLAYGNGTGALTTIDKAAQLAVDISDPYGNIWQAPQRKVQGQRPYWIMQPDPNGGGTVLGTGEHATIEFDITGIEATLPAGIDAATTIAHVSWHDIPGYNGGAKPVIITKRAGPQVTCFTADPSYAPLNQPSVQTVLTWDTAHATGVRFDAPELGPAQTFGPSGSGPIAGGINVPRGTSLIVTAYKDISSDRPAASGDSALGSDDVITATKSLRISGLSRTDLVPGLDTLGDIVIPPGSTRAVIFQMNSGLSYSTPISQALVLDLASHTIAATLDLNALVPSQFGDAWIGAAVPSPDGKTIHVLAGSDVDTSTWTSQFYLLPLDVARATYGKPVPVGTLTAVPPPTLLATPDGRTLYLTASDNESKTHAYAFDPSTYAPKGAWTWQPDVLQIGFPAPVACNADGSLLLMAGFGGLVVIDVADGFVPTGSLSIAKQLNLFPGRPAVSPDNSRAYALAVDNPQDPAHGHVLAIDVDLAAGSLSLAKDIPLGLVPYYYQTAALSPDAKTLYVLTGTDVLTAYDTSTYAAVPYQCGVNGDFTPLQIVPGPQPNVLYCIGHDGDTSGTVSIVTFP